MLSIIAIEWRESLVGGSYGVSPSGAFTMNFNEGYESGSGGWLKASMIPNDLASKVSYDVRVMIEDQDGGSSDWMELLNAFTVTNPTPSLIDYTIGNAEVFRGDTAYIFVNATDPSPDNDESDLTVQVDYKKQGETQWTSIEVNPTDYSGSPPSGHWAVPFSPDLDWNDDDLGNYEFRVRVYNGVAYSNEGNWNYTTGNTLVKNNLPEATNLNADGSTVERGSELLLWADGTDREIDERDLIPIFEYSTDGGTTWETSFLSNPTYNVGNSRWEVTFTPDPDEATLGDYDFQVRFDDGEDYSDNLIKTGFIEVTNAKPIVDSISLSDSTAFRMETITITAEVSDADQDEGTLTPNFQYKGSSGGWVSQSSSGSYFGEPNYIGGGRWEIEFTAPADADVGDYSFKVEFTDDAGDTSDATTFAEITDALTLENAVPEVEIDTPSSGSQDSAKVSFGATGHDEEDQTLTWLWDFGDGKESTDESPTHEYSKSGDYIVTVTVTDDDGDTAEDTVSITISDAVVGGGMDMMTLLLILIPIIVAVLIVVLLLTRKKKKPEEVPPAVPGAMAPGAPPAAAPPAMAAPPAPPPAAPPGAPPPVPAAPAAAVPAAAVAAAPAGQNIKCPKCGTPFTVTDTQRPLTIECPNCHAKGTLK
jgi:PKD repeat protein